MRHRTYMHGTDHAGTSGRGARIVILTLSLLLLAMAPNVQRASAAEPPAKVSSAVELETAEQEVINEKQPRRKRGSRKRAIRREKQDSSPAKSIDEGFGRVHLNGSFVLELGDTNVVRGEGSMTIELDRATTAKLVKTVDDHIDEATPLIEHWMQILADLPETLRTTSEILNRLADPETQKNLRQAEQLLQWLPRSPDQPEL